MAEEDENYGELSPPSAWLEPDFLVPVLAIIGTLALIVVLSLLVPWT